jgi:hypothetical protein
MAGFLRLKVLLGIIPALKAVYGIIQNPRGEGTVEGSYGTGSAFCSWLSG